MSDVESVERVIARVTGGDLRGHRRSGPPPRDRRVGHGARREERPRAPRAGLEVRHVDEARPPLFDGEHGHRVRGWPSPRVADLAAQRVRGQVRSAAGSGATSSSPSTAARSCASRGTSRRSSIKLMVQPARKKTKEAMEATRPRLDAAPRARSARDQVAAVMRHVAGDVGGRDRHRRLGAVGERRRARERLARLLHEVGRGAAVDGGGQRRVRRDEELRRWPSGSPPASTRSSRCPSCR